MRCLSRASRTRTFFRMAFVSMADEIGNTVACRVSHQALRDQADRLHLSGTDSAIFEAYRELIEDVASETFDAEGPFDDHGRLLVTSEALARVTRSA